MSSIPNSPLWYASGLRWIASLFEALADRLERTFGPPRSGTAACDLHFDSDIYLAEIKNRALRNYHY